MDEYRGRYDGYGHREPNYREPPPPPPPECPPEYPPECPPDCPPEPGLLTRYFPILLILLGAVGLYMWVGRDNGPPPGPPSDGPDGPPPPPPGPGGLGGLGGGLSGLRGGLGGIIGNFLK